MINLTVKIISFLIINYKRYFDNIENENYSEFDNLNYKKDKTIINSHFLNRIIIINNKGLKVEFYMILLIEY